MAPVRSVMQTGTTLGTGRSRVRPSAEVYFFLPNTQKGFGVLSASSEPVTVALLVKGKAAGALG